MEPVTRDPYCMFVTLVCRIQVGFGGLSLLASYFPKKLALLKSSRICLDFALDWTPNPWLANYLAEQFAALHSTHDC
jgi:hypothetical protein